MSLLQQVTPTVFRVPLGYVNAYLVGNPRAWVLIDTGERRHAAQIRTAAHAFAAGQPPQAIVLTHAHFDHAGSANELAQFWNIPVYASGYELPFLHGTAIYPPPDPTVGGFYGWLAHFVTMPECNFQAELRTLPNDLATIGLAGWNCLATPGHTPGHISLFNAAQGVLLAGDACLTIDFQSWLGSLTGWPQVAAPPAPYTLDWSAAEASIRMLATLRPQTLASGHGRPMHGPQVASKLARLAERFTRPRSNRPNNFIGVGPTPGSCAEVITEP